MRRIPIVSAIALSVFAFSGSAQACDMHGAGYGNFGFQNYANWKSYNPRASTIDPAYEDEAMTSPIEAVEKAKPSFSNAANVAALRAKTRLAKKDSDKKSNLSDKNNIGEKATLEADG